ncbi:AmmeMemoRadiSam system protein A [Breznakiellaceae bacterium SP9]
MDFTISQEERGLLLRAARETITARLESRQPQEPPSVGKESALLIPCGVFVSLHKGTALRGCIGRMASDEPLYKTVRLMAAQAAFSDPRFPPLAAAELPLCRIEISVLSPMELCPNPREVKVGVHGLYLSRWGRSGVLLPQVPLEQGWNLDEYLDYICTKAGLPARSYQAPDAQLYTFTAIVFGED